MFSPLDGDYTSRNFPKFFPTENLGLIQ